jgi:hypothetical protein
MTQPIHDAFGRQINVNQIDVEHAAIVADFFEWSGGFEPDECTIEERVTYADNAAGAKHTRAELLDLLGVAHILGDPII